jgi:hypothetical protein
MASFFWTFRQGRRISLQGRFTENAQEGPACRVRGRLRKLIDLAPTSGALLAELRTSWAAIESA